MKIEIQNVTECTGGGHFTAHITVDGKPEIIQFVTSDLAEPMSDAKSLFLAQWRAARRGKIGKVEIIKADALALADIKTEVQAIAIDSKEAGDIAVEIKP